jgi:hypothetical protein
MFTEEDQIRLIHDCRTALLNRMFDEFSRKPVSSAEQVSDEIIVIARAIQSALSESDSIGSPARGLFALALQQVLDSFLAGLLTDEAFRWLAQEQHRAEQILLEGIDLGGCAVVNVRPRVKQITLLDIYRASEAPPASLE